MRRNSGRFMRDQRNEWAPRGPFPAAAGVATAAATMLRVPAVHAAGSDLIRVALVGCGGRGSGAAENALSTTSGPIKLVAMADVFHFKMNSSYRGLQRRRPEQVDVPEDRRFIGFDGYQKAIDCLKPGDVAIFATPPAFRWVHFKYAIEKGVNVFMEKPVTVDGPTSRRMLALAEDAEKKNLKVGIGLMCRHCDARRELYDRIKSGQIGDILAMRAYRMGNRGGLAIPRENDPPELLWQVRRFHAFLWASGGTFSDYLIHNIDECCWMKDAWPVKAQALGARHYRGESLDQNMDTYGVEYTFADGTKLFLDARTQDMCATEFASYAHGTKGTGVISTLGHTPAKCRIYTGQNMTADKLAWAFPQPEPNPYQLEWDHLIKAIREDTMYNEVKRGVEASVVTSMGRMAAHTGKVITYDQMLNCDHEFAPNVDELTMESAPPLLKGEDGKYPVPNPGMGRTREY